MWMLETSSVYGVSVGVLDLLERVPLLLDFLNKNFWLFVFIILSSFALFDIDGRQVPQQIVIQVGEIFKMILKEVWFTLNDIHLYIFMHVVTQCNFE